jgi:O-acetyl-ADP-ribose deacetylase (regulator of RNase III)
VKWHLRTGDITRLEVDAIVDAANTSLRGGYPLSEAARIAIDAGRQYVEDFDAIIYCCFSESDAAVYRAAVEAYCR